MRVLGYGRVSQDDQEDSLPDQRSMVREFCNETDDKEYGEEHEFVDWYEDKGVSGSVYPAERPGFSDLIDHLNEDDSIDGVVVKNFKRLGRDPIDQITIKRFLERLHVGREIEIMCKDPWEGDRRSLMDPRVEQMKNSKDKLAEWNKALVFIVNGLADARDILAASVGSEKAAAQREKTGGAWGRNPRGLVTERMAFAESSSTDRYVPVESAEGEAIEDWENSNQDKDSWEEEHTTLAEVLTVLDTYLSEGTSPMESYADPISAGKLADQMGWSGSTNSVRNVWKKKEEYARIAVEFEDRCGYGVPESVRELV